MALSSSILRDDLIALFLADSDIGAIDGDALTALCYAISTAVVAHITSAGVVTVTNVTGVTTGAGVSGPGTGTIA